MLFKGYLKKNKNNKGSDIILNIRELLSERCEYPISTKEEDSLIRKTLESENDDEYVIIPDNHISVIRKQLAELMLKYNVNGIYDLNIPFVESGLKFFLISLTKNHIDVVKSSVFKLKNTDNGAKKININNDKFVLSCRHYSS